MGSVGTLLLGFAFSAVLVSAAVRWLGELTLPDAASATSHIAVAFVAAVLCAASFGHPHATIPFFGRQAPQVWKRSRFGALLWGLDAGLMVTTVRVTALTPFALFLAFTGVAPWWAGFAYAAGFGLPLSVLAWLKDSKLHYDDARVLSFLGLIRKVGIATLIVPTLVIVIDRSTGPELLVLLGAACRCGVVAVFGLSALAKLAAPFSLVTTVRALGFQERSARLLASLITVGELAAVISLFSTRTVPVGAAIVAAIAVAFAIAGTLALAQSLKVSCSCFGRSTSDLGSRQLKLLPLWVAMAGFGLLGTSQSDSMRTVWPASIGLICAAGFAASSLAQYWEPLRTSRQIQSADENSLIRFEESGSRQWT